MKRIYLVRHAHAEHKFSGNSDRVRILSENGKREAAFMGEILRKLGVNPELILTSSAFRATATSAFLANAVGYPVENIISSERLYCVPSDKIINELAALQDGINSVLLVGHNPEITGVAEYLTGVTIDDMPACAIIGVESDISAWSDITNVSAGKMLFYEHPKKYSAFA